MLVLLVWSVSYSNSYIRGIKRASVGFPALDPQTLYPICLTSSGVLRDIYRHYRHRCTPVYVTDSSTVVVVVVPLSMIPYV